MPRSRSLTVKTVKEQLLARLQSGRMHPGARFPSTRAIARVHGISCQSAQTVCAELEREGWIARRRGSGSYVRAKPPPLRGVELIFAAHARRAESVGGNLLQLLLNGLRGTGLEVRVRFATGDRLEVGESTYVAVWECRSLAMRLARGGRLVLLLNDRPAPGEAACRIDSVEVDHFRGGQAAARWLRALRADAEVAIFSGPRQDRRNRERIAGFRSLEPTARIVNGGSWFYDRALRAASRVAGEEAVFCCGDCLAAAVIDAAARSGRTPPLVVGFDGSLTARRMGFATIAVPWLECATAAVQLIVRRLRGERFPAERITLPPRLWSGKCSEIGSILPGEERAASSLR
jgi:Transcriptional regulators